MRELTTETNMPRKLDIPDSVAEEWRRRMNEGQSIESIARAYGLNHGTIRKRLGITAFEGRLGRSAEGREIHKHLIHMDVQTQQWIADESRRLNCTHGLFVEFCIEAMKRACATLPVSRQDLKQHMDMMREKESGNGQV
jgi:hypothetical protein